MPFFGGGGINGPYVAKLTRDSDTVFSTSSPLLLPDVTVWLQNTIASDPDNIMQDVQTVKAGFRIVIIQAVIGGTGLAVGDLAIKSGSPDGNYNHGSILNTDIFGNVAFRGYASALNIYENSGAPSISIGNIYVAQNSGLDFTALSTDCFYLVTAWT